jgi:hypothetical protein
LTVYSGFNPKGSVIQDVIPLNANVSAKVQFEIQSEEGQSRLFITPVSISGKLGNTTIYKQGENIVLNSSFGYDIPHLGKTGFYIEGENTCLSAYFLNKKYTLMCFGQSLQKPLKSIFTTNSNTLLSQKMVEEALNPQVSLSRIFPGLSCKA